MAVKTADPNILLSSAAALYAEAVGYYKDRASANDKDKYRRELADLDRELARDTDKYNEKLKRLEAELAIASDLNKSKIFDLTRDIVDDAMDINEKRGEYQAYAAVTGSTPGDGMRRATSALNGGELFATIKIQPRLEDWFRDKILLRVVNENFARRQEENTKLQIETAEKVRVTEFGPLIERERKIANYTELQAVARERGMAVEASKHGRMINDLADDNRRDSKKLFESTVIRGARSRGEFLVWNALHNTQTIGRGITITTSNEGPTVYSPTPTTITGNNAPIEPGLTIPPDEVVISRDLPPEAPIEATELPPTTTPPATPATPPVTTAPPVTPPALPPATTAPPVAPPVPPATPATPPPAAAPTAPADPFELQPVNYNDILRKLAEQAKLSEVTALSFIHELGHSHSRAYDEGKTALALPEFLEENFGINATDKVDPKNADQIKVLARAALIYCTAHGDPDIMDKIIDEAKADPNSDSAKMLQASDEAITASMGAQQELEAAEPGMLTDAQSQGEGGIHPATAAVALAGAAFVAKKGNDTRKRWFTPEGRLKAAETSYDKKDDKLAKEDKKITKREASAAEARARLDREVAAKPDDQLSGRGKEAREERRRNVEALEEKAKARRADYTTRKAEYDTKKTAELDTKRGAADESKKRRTDKRTNRQVEGDLTSDTFEETIKKEREKLAKRQIELADDERKLELKRAKDLDGDFTKEEKKLAAEKEAIRKEAEALNERERLAREQRATREVQGEAEKNRLISERDRLAAEKTAIDGENAKLIEDHKKLVASNAALNNDYEALKKQKLSPTDAEYVRQRAALDARLETNRAQRLSLTEQTLLLQAREGKFNADRAQYNSDMADHRKKGNSTVDIDRREPTLGNIEPTDAAKPTVQDLPKTPEELALDRQVKQDLAAERSRLAALEVERRRESHITVNADGSASTPKGPVTDGVYRTPGGHSANLARLDAEIAVGRQVVTERTTALSNEKRSNILTADQATIDADAAEHQKKQAQLDTDRRQLLADIDTRPDGNFTNQEEAIRERTRLQMETETALQQRRTQLTQKMELFALREGRLPEGHVFGATPGLHVPNIDVPDSPRGGGMKLLGTKSVRFLQATGFSGVGTAMGSLGMIGHVFGEAAALDRADSKTRGLSYSQFAMDGSAVALDASEMLLTRADRMAKAADVMDDLAKLSATSATVSRVARYSRIATPVATVLTVGSAGLEVEIGRRTGDASRAATAVGAASGALGGAAAGAAIGVWFGGVGAIPGAAIGAGCAVVGGVVFGWLGGKAGKAALTGTFEEAFGVNEKLAKAMQPGLNRGLVEKYDRNNDKNLSLDEVKAALEFNNIHSIRQLDTDKDGAVSTIELSRALYGNAPSTLDTVSATREFARSAVSRHDISMAEVAGLKGPGHKTTF